MLYTLKSYEIQKVYINKKQYIILEKLLRVFLSSRGKLISYTLQIARKIN